MNLNFFQKILFVWLVLSFIFWGIYITFFEFIWQLFYYYFIIIFCLFPILIYHKKVIIKLQSLKYPDILKFIILWYTTVLFEETFAALFNHLKEGFHLSLFFERIGQFWLFNIFAFTGFYGAWYFLLKKYTYSYKEIFIISGLWGLFSEKIIYALFANPIYFFFMSSMTIFVYGFMIILPMFSLKLTEKKILHPLLKYPLTLMLIFLFSFIPMSIVIILRTSYPWLFPPVEFIPL